MKPLVKELPSDLVLYPGAHDELSGRMCVMEAVAFVAGEPWSDKPECVCPVIAAFLRSWGEGIKNDAERTRLLAPLIPKVINTRSTPEVERARVILCIDWLCRDFLPAWLEMVPALRPHADALRAFTPVQSWDDLDAIHVPLRGTQQSSAAAWYAALAAALAAAMDAVRDTLKPTQEKLQQSAIALVERMIAVS